MKLYLVDKSIFVIAKSFDQVKELYPSKTAYRINADFIDPNPIPDKSKVKEPPITLKNFDKVEIAEKILSIYGDKKSLTYKELVAGIKDKFNMGFNRIMEKNGAVHQLLEWNMVKKKDGIYFVAIVLFEKRHKEYETC